MAALIILIVVLACVLAYVPSLPQIGRTLITIAIIILCVILLLDVLGYSGALYGGRGRLLCP